MKASKVKYHTLKSPVALPAEAPEWWQVLPYGEILIVDDDPLIMDDKTAPQVLAYFASLGRDMVIDYEHQTLKNVEAPAAGWIKELDWRGKDGLWARTEWTERGAGYIEAKEYRYFSPVLVSRKSDRRIQALINVALTNQPRTRNIAAIAAKLDVLQSMEDEDMGFLETMIGVFKLGADADEAAVEAAANAALKEIAELKEKQNVVAAKGVLDALKLSVDADEQQVLKAISGLSATGTAAQDLAGQVAALKQEISAMRREDLVELALKDGKTSPEELDKWGRDLAENNPEQFKLIVLSRPAGSVIPVGKTRVADDPAPGAADEDQLSINKMMGIDEEAWKKFGPK